MSKDILELRRSFRVKQLLNPNFFGNFDGVKLPDVAWPELPKAVVKKVGDTTYEELKCVAYNPQDQRLTAFVEVKLPNGYLGDSCTDGSKEHVRFYLDYGSGWVDAGVVNFDAHDLPFKDPLCYAVSIAIKPAKRSCCDKDPVLPRVRAILSWNAEPPANFPDWRPVWGNVHDCAIQIAPRPEYLCKLTQVDLTDGVLDEVDISVFTKVSETVLDLIPKGPTPPPSVPDYPNVAKVEDARRGFGLMMALSNGASSVESFGKLTAAGLDVLKIQDFIAEAKFNTSYEELECVGLNRDASSVHGAIRIKRPVGYSGDLCKTGSRQYVAFYINEGAGWSYVGTTSVKVHDIRQIPDRGLCYEVSHPISLQQAEWCKTGKARLRGILSWNAAPPVNDPDYVAPWGDWEECCVEVKPLPKGVEPGVTFPYIESVGSMPVGLIAADGFASGTNSAGLTADASPFGGRILIAGLISGAPDSSNPFVPRLQYRVMTKQPDQASFQAVLSKFTIFVTSFVNGVPGPQVPVDQVPDADGWVDYYPDSIGAATSAVERNILGVFNPSVEGLHHVMVEVKNPSVQGTPVPFHVDQTRPVMDVEITSGAGNCGKFGVGEVISGTYRMDDAHPNGLSLSVTPIAEANGAKPVITQITLPPPATPGPLTSGLSWDAGQLPVGANAGLWELDTTGMEPCGYNIRLLGSDRTIVNSATRGWIGSDIEGFCLDD